MKPCNHCQQAADPTLKHRGAICRPCYNASRRRIRNYAKDNNKANAKARRARYEASEKGLTRRKQRLFVGERYIGKAASVELAAAINAHSKRRRLEFESRFAAREKAEGVAPSAVPPEAEL